MISIDWVFLVVVGESGCWLAGCGVIYSANELPLVLLNSGETSFTWYWSAYFSVGSGSLVNIKLIKIWQTFFYFTLQALLHKRENYLSQSITYHKLPRLHWQATSRYWRYRGVNIAKKKKKKKLGFLWSFCQILTYEPTGSKKVAVKTTQEKWCYSLAIEIRPLKPG